MTGALLFCLGMCLGVVVGFAGAHAWLAYAVFGSDDDEESPR